MRGAIVALAPRAGGAGTRDCTVVKVGGGLLAHDGALDAACAALTAAAARGARLVVIAGGGPFADTVRATDRRHGLGDDAAHWMAILAMDQYAHWLTARLPDAVLVRSPYQAGAALDAGALAVLAPGVWLRDADTLPHAWSVTSDSIAAFAAGAMDAARLVLLKPVSGPVETLVDASFASVAPVGLPVVVAGVSAPGWARLLEG